MFEDYTKEELADMQYACLKKYEKLEIDTVKKALTGEIGTNAKMVEALEDLNYDYRHEMEDLGDNFSGDLNPITIEIFKQAEKDGENVIICARRHLEIFDLCDKAMNKVVYTNKDGQICDEYGVPLNKDGEHSLFETIKGGAADDKPASSFANLTPLGVIKGGKQ